MYPQLHPNKIPNVSSNSTNTCEFGLETNQPHKIPSAETEKIPIVISVESRESGNRDSTAPSAIPLKK